MEYLVEFNKTIMNLKKSNREIILTHIHEDFKILGESKTVKILIDHIENEMQK